MPEKTVKAGELQLWTEDFGDPADPTVLLIVGADAQAVGWPDSLCHGLAASGRHVIRYDHRNTGKSTLIDYDKNPYDCHDLARDALAVLDGYGVDAAHIVGGSMGGFIAQLLALDHPDRVRSLTLVATSSRLAGIVPALSGEASFFSPPPHADYLAHMAQVGAELTASPPATREELIEARFSAYAPLAGSTEFDLEECRAVLTHEYDRATNPWHPDASQHAIHATAAVGDLAPRLRALDVPTLVIHGTDDPIIPVEHGRALAATVPGATGLFVEGYGHVCPNAAVIEQLRAAIVTISGGG
ncbi:alpha/beta fold hydrolase [Streptomyces sp. NEAU-Y11]|uniref:alpha/beta fold hydrolase n=1 Tax=Streptomyces cucumeris TaxID=2962890 RepID=UPI0020C93670|nr:alpha/beta fold hydrolase [Streptomyces sp. NEAU-Y11]MCP9211791.1 alpha/beta fold hydrolase [Streptomyces sp. NEAU-Y11]